MSKVILDYQENIVPYSRDELLNRLDGALRSKRFAHVQRVEQMAIKLARLNGVDEEIASIAGLVHDYAKQRPDEDFIKTIHEYQLDPDLLNYGNSVWHGYVGWLLVKNELGITNIDVLNAVKYHTIGAPYMSKLAQIVYMADYIETGRDFPGVEEARQITFDNLANGVAYQTFHTLDFLVNRHVAVFPKTIDTFNAWVPTSDLYRKDK
ncbi:bis(5'-nucleosyl)-tetraphosphatase (symmetrical) YqeK [Nicoliella spurrieriana]|uniref:bis(5'-nucleosyl)-tetraphosphatase (symmetrical) n=1 Tax=Nicoliella spurrieriana TaxID=2925830 RepID=A0A976X5B8_9LACO|nr:bis(5'-nucleosyl)-tetraphosphatase (symmetrical) YqeK [Nicoliella spurrieriana]UQS86700.1 bis(5'-nucleosyl)-tetraphosphatase (symmetrical) YqeK [Nicoliella spurrieriana]